MSNSKLFLFILLLVSYSTSMWCMNYGKGDSRVTVIKSNMSNLTHQVIIYHTYCNGSEKTYSVSIPFQSNITEQYCQEYCQDLPGHGFIPNFSNTSNK